MASRTGKKWQMILIKDFFNSLSLLLEKTEKGEEDLENVEAGINFAIEYILYIKQVGN